MTVPSQALLENFHKTFQTFPTISKTFEKKI